MKTWCDHIKYLHEYIDGNRRYSWWMDSLHRDIPKSWKMCPICGIERPTKANLAALTLQTLMDGDQ
jgi:hypothetical protein